MEWRDDRKYVLETIEDLKTDSGKTRVDIQTIKECVVTKNHRLDKRVSRMEIIVTFIATCFGFVGSLIGEWFRKN